MQHKLIELTKYLSMPAPMNSTGPGEAWVWGDYVLTLQTRPKKVSDALSAITGKPAATIPMEYPFALTVFYRKDRNPYGPSSRPIAIATLEQADYAAVLKQMGGLADIKDLGMGNTPKTVQAMFTADGHLNFGEYEGPLTLDAAREHLLGSVRAHFSLAGEPVKIGTIQDVYGHPNTGWPAIEPKKAGTGFLPAKEPKKTGAGCLVLLAAFCSLSLLICLVFTLNQ